MERIVIDSSIIIDLIGLDLLPSLAKCPFEINTTDLIQTEIKKNPEILIKLIKDKVVKIRVFATEELEFLLDQNSDDRSISIHDHSVIFLANELSAIILTSDNKLASKAKALKLEIHGIIWIIETMLKAKIITKKVAKSKILDLPNVNSWISVEWSIKQAQNLGL